MSDLLIPRQYKAHLNIEDTQKAIRFLKEFFQEKLAYRLNLKRVSAPIMVLSNTGINDYLSGDTHPISFQVKELREQAEIVQSLAKWKRVALADYGFRQGEGIYTDMNAIRPEEELDNIHSVYVDQWDWERVISEGERNLNFLKSIATEIYQIVKETEEITCKEYPQLPAPYLPDDITFIHCQELEDRWPEVSPVERENLICQEKGAVFIIGIGGKLKSGMPHDNRASDYDDWITETENGQKGLNGDILVWYPLLERAFELSSMGIRVDKHSLLKQLDIKGENEKKELYYHRRILNDDLPLTIGGGIGQSRLCMLFLRKAHIGEVQVGLWPEETIKACRNAGIFLL